MALLEATVGFAAIGFHNQSAVWKKAGACVLGGLGGVTTDAATTVTLSIRRFRSRDEEEYRSLVKAMLTVWVPAAAVMGTV